MTTGLTGVVTIFWIVRKPRLEARWNLQGEGNRGRLIPPCSKERAGTEAKSAVMTKNPENRVGTLGAAVRPIEKLRFVVITRNSARWFGTILDRYQALSISPFVMLDRTSDDNTEELLAGRNIEYAKVSAEFPRVESLISGICGHVHSEWVVRLDDDELPSCGLCEWVEARLDGLDRIVVGFQRRWIRLTADGRCEYSRHPLMVSRLGVLDAQWRMFRPTEVRYRPDIHTPGFYVPKGSPIAPHRAYIAHFTWLVRSAGERRLQVADYDRQEPNAGSRFRDVKVWEDCDVGDHEFRPMETDEFNEIAAALAALCVVGEDAKGKRQ
jgi:hypothetical protein